MKFIKLIALCIILLFTTFTYCTEKNNFNFGDNQKIKRTFKANTSAYSEKRKSSEDWKKIIDNAWEPKHSTEEQLVIFDKLYNEVDRNFACFQGINIDLELLKSTYRNEISNGVSRGRFAAILNHFSMALRESHTRISDRTVNFYTQLTKGTPLFYIGGWGNNYHFGAGLTPLKDKSLLVYSVVENHPLGIEPGDIILGYDGRNWNEIYPELLEVELPVTGFWWGSSPISFEHSMLMSVGSNWHLFNTIDIKKYKTGEIVHLDTSLMEGFHETHFATEQLEVKGIPKLTYDDYLNDKVVSYGIVDGTNIGYIYVLEWYGDTVENDFRDAIKDLMENYETDGLIIDYRTNYGGNMNLSNKGLEYLFNDVVKTVGFGKRKFSGEHNEMINKIYNEKFYNINGDPSSFYSKPIAVLTGPGAISSGDQNALRMKFHPNAKFFGKTTATAFNGPSGLELGEDFYGRLATADAYLVSDRSNYLTHDEFSVDFSVWFTPDDVANKKDSVVDSAISWINYKKNENKICESIRWISHVTGEFDAFGTSLIFHNQTDGAKTLKLSGFNAEGDFISEKEIVITGKTQFIEKPFNLFNSYDVTHIKVCGSLDCSITPVYKIKEGVGASCHASEVNQSGQEFVFYAGEWDIIFDGMAIINTSENPCKITGETLSEEGAVLETITISEELVPNGKIVNVMEAFFPNGQNKTLKITSTENIQILILRGTRPGTEPGYLYQVIPTKLK